MKNKIFIFESVVEELLATSLILGMLVTPCAKTFADVIPTQPSLQVDSISAPAEITPGPDNETSSSSPEVVTDTVAEIKSSISESKPDSIQDPGQAVAILPDLVPLPVQLADQPVVAQKAITLQVPSASFKAAIDLPILVAIAPVPVISPIVPPPLPGTNMTVVASTTTVSEDISSTTTATDTTDVSPVANTSEASSTDTSPDNNPSPAPVVSIDPVSAIIPETDDTGPVPEAPAE